MSTPITYPTYPQGQAYATAQDVLDLLGAITFNTTSNDPTLIAKYLKRAKKYIDSRTGRSFGPVYHKEEYDGNGTASLQLEHYPVISLDYVKNFISPVMLQRVQLDFNLICDREAGIVRCPPTLVTNTEAQYWYNFYRGNMNVQAAYWTGFTEFEKAEVLTTTDHQTYSFANPQLAKTIDQTFGPIISTSPTYLPIVYLNGQRLQNTTYVYNELANGNVWEVDQDNIYYAVNWSAGTIAFNSPNQTSDVVTADYSYWLVPEDVQLACAKFAASEVLKVEGIGLGGKYGQGAAIRQLEGAKVQYGRNSTQPWEGVLDSWKADIEETIQTYIRATPPTQNGSFNAPGAGFGW